MTFRSKFFVSQYRKFSLGNTSVYQKISGIEKFYASERGVSRFFVENFLSHRTRKTSLGNTSVYQKISGIEKFYASERGGYHVSSSKTFCHTVPKNFVREHFGASENFAYRKTLCIRRGYH